MLDVRQVPNCGRLALNVWHNLIVPVGSGQNLPLMLGNAPVLRLPHNADFNAGKYNPLLL